MVIKSSKGQYIFSSMEKLEQSHWFQTELFSPVFYHKFVSSSVPSTDRLVLNYLFSIKKNENETELFENF